MRTKVHQIGSSDVCLVSSYRLPLYTEVVHAGFPSPAEDFLDQRLDLNEYLVPRPTATFFLRVSGNAMHQAGIVSGDIVIVDRSLEPSDGAIVIAVIDGEMLIRRYKQVSSQIWLIADPYAEEAIVPGQDQQWEVWGVVTSIIHQTRASRQGKKSYVRPR